MLAATSGATIAPLTSTNNLLAGEYNQKPRETKEATCMRTHRQVKMANKAPEITTTGNQTYIQTDRQTEKADRQTDQTYRQTDRADIHTYRQIYRRTDRQKDRQTDTDRQTDRDTYRQTDIHTYIHTYRQTDIYT